MLTEAETVCGRQRLRYYTAIPIGSTQIPSTSTATDRCSSVMSTTTWSLFFDRISRPSTPARGPCTIRIALPTLRNCHGSKRNPEANDGPNGGDFRIAHRLRLSSKTDNTDDSWRRNYG
jgi:hypothetical protein